MSAAPDTKPYYYVPQPSHWPITGSVVPAGYTFVAWSESGRHVFLTGGERSARRTDRGHH